MVAHPRQPGKQRNLWVVRDGIMVTMTTTVNDINDVARILREHPDWLATIRGIIVGEELLNLPQEVAKFVQATNENFRLVNERLDRLEADVAELKSDVAELKGDVAELKTGQAETNQRLDRLEGRFNSMEGRFSNFEGSDFERKARQRILLYANLTFDLNDPAIVMTQDAQSTPALHGGIHRAIRAGLITREQAVDFFETDIVIADQDGRHVLVETSITMDNDDVARAVRRAAILSTAVNAVVLPAVATANAAEPQRAFAEEQGVAVFTLRYRRTPADNAPGA